VVLPADLAISKSANKSAGSAPKRSVKKAAAGASGNSVTSPMQGTIVKVAVSDGQSVNQGDLVIVLEAMKMEQPLTAHKSGTVTNLTAQIGTTVPSGTVLLEITD
jgi:acetyl-CoA/propionyl-CoA carboxylase biotin carboxyl carrier protein